MGNRATVIFTDGKENHSVAIYLHWNGGPESIYGFVEEMDRRKIPADQDYEAARFIHIVGEFFDQDSITGLSLGCVNGPDKITEKALEDVNTDHSDNGFYIINRTGADTSVRRFITRYIEDGKGHYNERLEEMAPDLVERERREAKEHKYAASFRETFLEMTNGKKMEMN